MMKAQATAFIVLGIVVLIAVGSVLLLRPAQQSAVQTGIGQAVFTFTQQCLQQSVDEAVSQLGSGALVCYQDRSFITVSEVQEFLQQVAQRNLEGCLDYSAFAPQGMTVDEGDYDFSLRVRDASLEAGMRYSAPLTVSDNRREERFDAFSYDSPRPVRALVQTAASGADYLDEASWFAWLQERAAEDGIDLSVESADAMHVLSVVHGDTMLRCGMYLPAGHSTINGMLPIAVQVPTVLHTGDNLVTILLLDPDSASVRLVSLTPDVSVSQTGNPAVLSIPVSNQAEVQVDLALIDSENNRNYARFTYPVEPEAPALLNRDAVLSAMASTMAGRLFIERLDVQGTGPFTYALSGTAPGVTVYPSGVVELQSPQGAGLANPVAYDFTLTITGAAGSVNVPFHFSYAGGNFAEGMG